MKKYRIAYDNLFLPNDLENGIYYNNEKITDISIYMVFRVIDKSTGEEVYFQDEDLIEQKLEYAKNKYCYVDNFYKCVIDENEIFRMIPNEKLLKESNYIVLHNRHFNRIKTESILFIKFLCDTNCCLQIFFFSPQLPAFTTVPF